LLAATGIVLLTWLLSPLAARREIPLAIPQSTLSFNTANACRVTEEFVAQFPTRVFGSLESRQSSGYLIDALTELGFKVEYSHFDARIEGPKKVGRNILALKEGKETETIVLIAHFDTAPTTEQGAMKNGAAVGVLLELARLFAATPTRRNLLFAFSDAGEWGMLGARELAENYPERDSIVAVLSLDHVSLGELDSLLLEANGQLVGFSPPWLRRLAEDAAETQRLPVAASSGLKEHFERAILISRADHGPFLRAGIPAINLGSTSVDRARARAVYHSAQDTIENIQAASIEIYGRAAERIVAALDGVPSIPSETSGYFRLWGSRFMAPQVMVFLHCLLFLPPAVFFFFYAKNHHGQLSRLGIVRELLAYAGTLLPLLSLYFFVFLARGLRKIPIYELYPATPKDPVLDNPPWGLLGIIFGAAFIIAVTCAIIEKLSFEDFPKPNYSASKLVLLSLMILVVTGAILHNSYWAAAFLLLPAWIWTLIDGARSLRKRSINLLLICAAAIPYFAMLSIHAREFNPGGSLIWYQVLALSTGLFTETGFYLAVAAIALGIRFICIQFHESVA